MPSLKERVRDALAHWMIKRDFLRPILHAALHRAHEVGRTEGFAEGQATGYDEGYVAGHDTGGVAGYTRGFAEGENVFRLLDERGPVHLKALDVSLYGPKRFIVTDAMVERMRAQVEAAARARLIGRPTEDQWRMILADHPSTCVSAGAGSGKSTTLVLRVIFMVEHLRIPLSDLTVISFTVASCEELKSKLARVLGYWQDREIDSEDLKQTVSTYHSLLLRLTRPGFPAVAIFEHGDEVKISRDEDNEDVEDPALASSLNVEQMALLHETYVQLFQSDEVFRAHAIELFKREFDLSRSVPADGTMTYRASSWRYASEREKPIIETMRHIWTAWGLERAGLDLGPHHAFTHMGHPFFADARVGPDGPWVILGLPNGNWPEEVHAPGHKDPTKLTAALATRRKIFAAHCSEPVVHLKTPRDLEQLTLLAKALASDGASDNVVAPKFEVKLPGEPKAVGFTEALFQQGSFISSLGRDVPALLGEIPAWRPAQSYEHHFTACLSLFWGAFETLLADRKILPFNRAFMLSTLEASSMRLNTSVLNGMRHLLVDEFQDISPLVADWLVAMQRNLLDKSPSKPVSIMSIGDDWQSIYGWRGSSPDLFIRFAHYFPSHADLGPAEPIELADNFRSVPDVVIDADLLVRHVSHKQSKRVRANVVPLPDDHGLRLFEYRSLIKGDEWPKPEQVAEVLKPLIVAQYLEAKAWPHRSKDILLVMTRGNAMRKAIRRALPELDGLSVRTYHRAKGLEADVAFMIDDCAPGDLHPFRNAVYEASNRFATDYSYEQAQKDEAYRLAYVGVTRGKRRTLWYVREIQGSFAANACREKLVISA